MKSTFEIDGMSFTILGAKFHHRYGWFLRHFGTGFDERKWTNLAFCDNGNMRLFSIQFDEVPSDERIIKALKERIEYKASLRKEEDRIDELKRASLARRCECCHDRGCQCR